MDTCRGPPVMHSLNSMALLDQELGDAGIQAAQWQERVTAVVRLRGYV